MFALGRHAAATLLVAVVVASGCHKKGPETGFDATANATLQVQNQGFSDMNIYVIRSGERVRVGTATGLTTSTMTIPNYLLTGSSELRFLADPVGGARAPISEAITVHPGDTVVLQIPPT